MNSFNNSNFCPLLRENYAKNTAKTKCKEMGGSLQSADGMDVCVYDSRGYTLDDYSIKNLQRSYENAGGHKSKKYYDYICLSKYDDICGSGKIHVKKVTKGKETVFFTNNGGLRLKATLRLVGTAKEFKGEAEDIVHPNGNHYNLN